MTTQTSNQETLAIPTVAVQTKLAAAWTSLMFLVIYVDYYHLYQPGVLDALRDGRVFEFDISPTLMIVLFAVIAVPTLMVLLSVALPPRVNRILNLVVASVYIPVMVFNVAGVAPSWFGYYGVTIGVEVLILAFILRSAWTWPGTAAV